ncbi:hypothetical protein HRH25_01290 [Flavisolibacter sp. BT320]|nr:hypothetical protein [Flavisolibacter longurius]
MERIFTLIDKLSQQKAQGAPAANLLFTVQLLQQELLQLQKKGEQPGTRKVAVTLPFQPLTAMTAEPIVVPVVETVAPVQQAPAPVEEEKEIYFLDVVEEEPAEAPAPVVINPAPDTREYMLRKPPVQELFFEASKPVEEPKPTYVAQQLFNSAFETTVEVPTLSQYKTAEVHERIAEKKESLNDRLKQEKTELAHVLKETPIKDLRKGIGINDRFVFVKELFRGDDAAYERSIKTINNFGIYSEAEYWMSRELKLKLGWDEDNTTVQHFYQLVRRRFS